MAHDHPLVEGMALAQEVIVLHTPPPVQLLHPLQGGDASVDEDQVLRLQDGGHGPEPGPLRRERLPQIRPVGLRQLLRGHNTQVHR